MGNNREFSDLRSIFQGGFCHGAESWKVAAVPQNMAELDGNNFVFTIVPLCVIVPPSLFFRFVVCEKQSSILRVEVNFPIFFFPDA